MTYCDIMMLNLIKVNLIKVKFLGGKLGSLGGGGELPPCPMQSCATTIIYTSGILSLLHYSYVLDIGHFADYQ